MTWLRADCSFYWELLEKRERGVNGYRMSFWCLLSSSLWSHLLSLLKYKDRKKNHFDRCMNDT